MQDPLKQGLKLIEGESGILACAIRMQDPLKQGLKQNILSRERGGNGDSNARSIKTRIETRT